MIAATAAVLVGLFAPDAEAAVLRGRAPRQWTVSETAAPIELRYRRDPGRLVLGGARATLPLSPSTTLFLQARKPIESPLWDPSSSAGAARGRAYSVGLAVRW